MNKFAQLLYGKVIYIFETHLTKEELSTIFSPSTFWIDVTGMDCEEGYVAEFREGVGIVLTPPPSTEKSFEELKSAKLEQVDIWTRQAIIGGFVSTAKGSEYIYDSTDADQSTLRTMYIASQSPDFATTAPYNGQIPIRAIPKDGSEKVVLGHNKAEMQKLMDDMALHIGVCKQRGWELQSVVNEATTQVELDKIKWEVEE